MTGDLPSSAALTNLATMPASAALGVLVGAEAAEDAQVDDRHAVGFAVDAAVLLHRQRHHRFGRRRMRRQLLVQHEAGLLAVDRGRAAQDDARAGALVDVAREVEDVQRAAEVHLLRADRIDARLHAGEVDDGLHLVHRAVDGGGIAHVGMEKLDSVERGDALALAGRKIVENAHFAAGGGERAGDVGAEESSATGDENFGSLGEHFL